MGPSRVVVAGLGGMSREWLRYAVAHPEVVELRALVDIVPAAARQRADEFGLGALPVYTTVDEALAAEPADVLWDITLPETREAVVGAALRHGVDVCSEKPMAASWDAALRLANLARAGQRRFLVMQNRRYNAGIRQLRDLVARGVVGTPGFAAADFFLGPHFGGFREAMAEPLLLDMAIHTFDQARFILGGRPRSVYCHAYNPPGSWYRGHAGAVALFEWDQGLVFEYRGSWAAEGAPTSWESTWRIVGSRGTALWDGEHAPYAEVLTEAAAPSFLRETHRVEAGAGAPGVGGHAAALAAMMQAIRDGVPGETDYSDNLQSLGMVFGAIASAARGQKIWLVNGGPEPGARTAP